MWLNVQWHDGTILHRHEVLQHCPVLLSAVFFKKPQNFGVICTSLTLLCFLLVLILWKLQPALYVRLFLPSLKLFNHLWHFKSILNKCAYHVQNALWSSLVNTATLHVTGEARNTSIQLVVHQMPVTRLMRHHFKEILWLFISRFAKQKKIQFWSFTCQNHNLIMMHAGVGNSEVSLTTWGSLLVSRAPN